MYINHHKAKKAFNTLIENEYQNWIIISGGSDSGKTSFIREVCPFQQTIFFETDLSFFYLNGLIPYISSDVKFYLKNYLSKDLIHWNILKSKFDIDYINDIMEENYDEIIRMLISIDILEKDYKYANYLGNKFSERFSYIVLDDFYKCDKESYEWLLHFTNKYLNKKRYIIAICDFEKQWESNKVCEIFCDVQALIDIKCFDTEEDYFNVLKEEIYFDNIEKLRRIAKQLFGLYHGDAQLLLKTIKIYGSITDRNDYDRQRRLFKIAHNLTFHTMKYSSKIHQLVLEFFALSPVSFSKCELSKILEVEENIIQSILMEQYNENLLELVTKDNSQEIYYNISDSLIRNMIMHNVEDSTRNFIFNRLWTLTKSRVIEISTQAQLELSLELINNESEELLWEFLHDNCKVISEEKQIEYINRLYLLDLHITHKFSNFKNAKKLYDYGYYQASLKILEYLLHQKNIDYSFYMLLGDVQHILLLPEASSTFEQAANLSDITISQKLSAINGQIMSLNQSDQEGSLRARKLYDETFEKFSNEKCDGLIELYRNTNNSYCMEDALEYTIKGYYLALELNNTLEQYKCMHNICMIRLHQNVYPYPIQNLDVIPSFELVDEYFQNNPKFYHERAYPLLDLGTYEMIKYVSCKKIEHLKRAKAFYSNAQLFAKSFYARNIAEVSLLVTNTHLYCKEVYMLDSLRKNRNELFMKYMNQDIVDYRVNRKILLSLAVSAVLTKDIEEAKKYLELVRKYIWGQETLRYNNLCSICNIPPIEIKAGDYNNDSYYASTEFVPWLISLGH